MIDLIIEPQPDDETCGPTCLHAIYRYYGMDISLDSVINTVSRSLSGGTLAPMLGAHALMQGYETCIYINNLDLFDPSWFEYGEAPSELLAEKLKLQSQHKRNPNIAQGSKAYLEYLSLGGLIHFKNITVPLLKEYFDLKIPILTGLSATYLYDTARERFTRRGKSYSDDIRGKPCGHFIVLCGYDEHHRLVVVADPHRKNPISQTNYYKVSSLRLINAIMLGVLTYDANLLIIQPKSTSWKP